MEWRGGVMFFNATVLPANGSVLVSARGDIDITLRERSLRPSRRLRAGRNESSSIFKMSSSSVSLAYARSRWSWVT